MELVHDHVMDFGVGTLPECYVGQNLSGAAEDGSIVVHGGVASGETDILGSELPTQSEPLLVDQGLDRTGVYRATSLGQGLVVESCGYQGFSGSSGCVEDDIAVFEQLQDSLLLRRVEGDSQR